MSMGSEGHHGTGHGGEEDGKVAEPNRVQPVAPAPRVDVLGLHEQGVEREMHVTVRRVVLAATSAGHFVLGDYNDRGDDRSALRIDRGPREGRPRQGVRGNCREVRGTQALPPFRASRPGPRIAAPRTHTRPLNEGAIGKVVRARHTLSSDR